MTIAARSVPCLRACRHPADMVGLSVPFDMARRSFSSDRSSLNSVSVAGKRDSDVRIQKRGILLQERGFMLHGRTGGAHHV